MTAHKTGLPHYTKDGKDYYAAQITAIELIDSIQHIPELVNSKTLWFGNRKANVMGEWINANNPQVGNWFVVEDVIPTKQHPFNQKATCVLDEDFIKNFAVGE